MATDIIARGMAAGVVSQVSADKQAVSEDRDAVEAAKTEVLNVAESIPEDYSTLSADVSELKEDLELLVEQTTKKEESQNRLNPTAITVGKDIATDTGLEYNASSISCSDYIPVKKGDVVYFCAVKSDGSYLYASATNSFFEYGENKEYLHHKASYTNAYVVVDDNTKYIRTSWMNTGAFGTALILSLTLNSKPNNSSEIVSYIEPHFLNPFDFIKNNINTKIIEAWGDSRTEMYVNSGTSFTNYLDTMLGGVFTICNFGVSSQTACMVSARFGTNEVFVSLENNKINATGVTNITAVKCTIGNATADLKAHSVKLPYGIPCYINGVRGVVNLRESNERTFTRIDNGSEVSVRPYTKIIVDDWNSQNHMGIFWCGINDLAFNTANPHWNVVVDSVVSMAESLNHKKFIILGEMYSVDGSNTEKGKECIDNINNYYATHYPNNYIDIQSELIARGLQIESITPTAEDTENITKGLVPFSLMTDNIHPNESGRHAVAKIIYDFMVAKNWV